MQQLVGQPILAAAAFQAALFVLRKGSSQRQGRIREMK
jgi:hypothetical protein